MKEININIEGYNVNGICVGCLNYNRQMFYHSDVKECFRLLGNIDVPDDLEVQVCWECLAYVRNAIRFKRRMLKSYDFLIQYSKEHTFLDSPNDFTPHSSTRISRTNVETCDCTPGAEGTHTDVQEVDRDEVKVETDEKYDFAEVPVKEEFPEDSNFEDLPDVDVTSDEDIQLSKLKEQETGKVKRKRKKEDRLDEDDPSNIKIKKLKESKPKSRKLKNLPEDVVELYTMSKQEMWDIRTDDLNSKEFQTLKYRKNYNQEDVQKAITALENGGSIYKVSRRYNIPESTLRNKRDKKYTSDVPGRKTVLTKVEENQIVEWIHYLDHQGFSVSKELLKQGVAKLVESLKRPNNFKDGIPGRQWLVNFLTKHPTVAKIAEQPLQHRKKITEQEVRSWFRRVTGYFKSNNMLDVLQDESRIYNCNETAFYLYPKEEVLVKKGSKRLFNRIANDENECLNVFVSVSAAGEVAPSMVLFPYKRLPKNLARSVPPTWGVGCTDLGWMNMDTFYEYVANVFYKWLLDNKIKMPVVLFMDGHTSHISLPLSLFCKEKGIILVALLPNSTHLLQPLDGGVIQPVTDTWKNVVTEFKVKNNCTKLKRKDFAGEVKKCFDLCLKADTIRNCFKNAGIYPFDVNNIDFSEVIPQDSDSTGNKSQEQAKGILEQFEERLPPEVLDLFVESGHQWKGEEKYRCLFEVWKRIQHQESQTLPIVDDSKIVNSIEDFDFANLE